MHANWHLFIGLTQLEFALGVMVYMVIVLARIFARGTFR